MPELTTCECIPQLTIAEKLDQIFCALISGDVGDATAANQVLEIAQLVAINGKLPAALGQAAMAASFPVVIASDQSTLPVADALADAALGVPSGAAVITDAAGTLQQYLRGLISLAVGTGFKAATQGYSQQVNITRPANTTAYAAGDVLGGAFEITAIGPSAGRIFLTSFALLPQISAIPAGMTSFRLHLYNVTPPSAIADNSPWTFDAGDWASYLGYVDLGFPTDFGAALFTQVDQINKQVKLAGTSLFGYLVTNGGFTPAANSEVYRLDAHATGI